MVNKGGWLRVVEASIAVLLIIGAVLTVSKSGIVSEDKKLNEDLAFALNSIAENSTIRNYIILYKINENEDSANNLPLIAKINESLYYQFKEVKPKILFRICGAEDSCQINYSKAVFSYERIISINESDDEFSPKKIRVSAW